MKKIALWWADIKGNGQPESMHPLYRMAGNFVGVACWIFLFIAIILSFYKTLMHFAVLIWGNVGADLRAFPIGAASFMTSFFILVGLVEVHFKYKEQHKLWKLRFKK